MVHWIFGGTILCCEISDTASPCRHGEAQAQVILSVQLCTSPTWRKEKDCNPKFIGHTWYSSFITLHMHSFKKNHKNWSDQNQTSQTACYLYWCILLQLYTIMPLSVTYKMFTCAWISSYRPCTTAIVCLCRVANHISFLMIGMSDVQNFFHETFPVIIAKL